MGLQGLLLRGCSAFLFSAFLPAEPLLAGDFLPSGHPVKSGTDTQLEMPISALDREPDLRESLC